MITLKIADIIVDIDVDDSIKETLENNDAKNILHKSFFDFLHEKKIKKNDILWKIEFLENKEVNNGKCIFNDNNTLKIYLDNDNYIYSYIKKDTIPKRISCTKNFNKCVFYIPSLYKNEMNNIEVIEKVKICLYNMFREMFFYRAMLKKMLPIHSVSIIFKDKAYLFSADSGVGKSTHTNMWHDLYNVEILDGDVTMCTVEEKNGKRKAVAYGMPWCGTSDLYMNKKVEFEGIVFLQRGKENEIMDIDRRSLALGIFKNNFAVWLTEELVDSLVECIEELSKYIDGYILKCLPNNEAVEVVKNTLEKRSEEKLHFTEKLIN